MAKVKRITYITLNALVLAEATKLKEEATKKELERVNFANLDTKSKVKCIYGQMTGFCFSDRATALIEKSCERVFRCVDTGKDEINGELNGSPKESNRTGYWSPIEVFIDKKRNKENGNNKRLVAFLNGKTKTLNLK